MPCGPDGLIDPKIDKSILKRKIVSSNIENFIRNAF